MSARVTILVVAYDQAPYVDRCLASALAQTVPVEVVAIDDASPDGTADRLAAYAEQVRVVLHEQNVGLARSLQEGLALVDTELFAYIAGDDWMEPDRVARQLAALDAAGPDCALVYSDAYRAGPKGERRGLFSELMGDAWQPDASDVFGALLRDNWIPAPTAMIRTAALREAGGYDPEIFYEDHDVNLRLAARHSFAFVDAPLATHRELYSSLGYRMFFSGEHTDEWRRARVLIYRKQLGVRREHDAWIAGLVGRLVVQLYLAGEPPAWVADRLAEVVSVEPSRRTSAYRLLARAGVPGRWVARVRRLLRRRGR